MQNAVLLSAILPRWDAHDTAKYGAEIVLIGKAQLVGNLTNPLPALQKNRRMAHFHFGEIPGNSHARVFGEDLLEIGQTHIAKSCDFRRADLLAQMFLQYVNDLGIPQSRGAFHNAAVTGVSHGVKQPTLQL